MGHVRALSRPGGDHRIDPIEPAGEEITIRPHWSMPSRLPRTFWKSRTKITVQT